MEALLLHVQIRRETGKGTAGCRVEDGKPILDLKELKERNNITKLVELSQARCHAACTPYKHPAALLQHLSPTTHLLIPVSYSCTALH